MIKKNQNVLVTVGPAKGLVGKVISNDKNHPVAPFFVCSDKNTPEDEQVMGRFKLEELEPVKRFKEI